MNMKPIKSEEEYETILEWIDIQFNNKPDPASQEGIILKNALKQIKIYEDIHYKIPPHYSNNG